MHTAMLRVELYTKPRRRKSEQRLARSDTRGRRRYCKRCPAGMQAAAAPGSAPHCACAGSPAPGTAQSWPKGLGFRRVEVPLEGVLCDL